MPIVESFFDPSRPADDRDEFDRSVFLNTRNIPFCDFEGFDFHVTVAPSSPIVDRYVNVWFDFNQDGDWDDQLLYCCLSMIA